MTQTLVRELAGIVDAYHRCLETGNDWAAKHKDRAEWLVKNHMPSGSGIDCGTTLDLERSTGERLVFATSFHHMDDGGSYDGWTNHEIIVKASLVFGLSLRIMGNDRNQIKDYLHEVYRDALNAMIDPQAEYAAQTA